MKGSGRCAVRCFTGRRPDMLSIADFVWPTGLRRHININIVTWSEYMVSNDVPKNARGDWTGIAGHYRRRTDSIVVAVRRNIGYPVEQGYAKGKLYNIQNRSEAYVYLLAHELRHAWQKWRNVASKYRVTFNDDKEHRVVFVELGGGGGYGYDYRSRPPRPRWWLSRHVTREADADEYAVKMVKAWRKRAARP